MANGFDALLTIVYMLRTFSRNKDYSYDWVQGRSDDEFHVIRVKTVWDGGDDVSGSAYHICRDHIYRFKREELNNLTPTDIMFIYKKLHREEYL